MMTSAIVHYLQGVTVLLAEDDEESVKKIARTLGRRVKNVLVARNGQEAYELFCEHHPDIVISDIEMPIMNGLVLGEKIRMLDPYIPLVFMTAYTEKTVLSQAISVNADGFINKPIPLGSLDEVLQKCATKALSLAKTREYEYLLAQEQKHAALNRLLTNISHYWRNPLAAAVAQFEYLTLATQWGTLTPEKIKEITSNGIQSLMALSRNIDRFLGFYKGGLPLHMVSVDQCVRSIIDLVRESFQAKEIVFHTDIHNDFLFEVPEQTLGNVLMELFANALNAFESIPNSENKTITVSVHCYENRCIIGVEDNAGGINPDKQKLIFEPYVTDKHPQFQAGLGLFCAKKSIKEELQGTLCYESRPKGSYFLITLYS